MAARGRPKVHLEPRVANTLSDPAGEGAASDVVCSDPPPRIDFDQSRPPVCVACGRGVYHDSIEGWHHREPDVTDIEEGREL